MSTLLPVIDKQNKHNKRSGQNFFDPNNEPKTQIGLPPKITSQSDTTKLFEHVIRHGLINKPNLIFPEFDPRNDFNPKNNFESKNDFELNFSESIDIKNDSIFLALNTLNMSKSEYNLIDIYELKSQRRIDLDTSSICALNILIHYKEKSKFIRLI